MLSIFVRTYNEEVNISSCLEALAPHFDDIIVLDQYSSDGTVKLCSNFPVRVVQHERFSSEAAQLNWAFANLPFKQDWVYICDADEVVPSDLALELIKCSNAGGAAKAYALRYKNFFCGRWLKHCGIYPVWVTRMFLRGQVSWSREINTSAHVDGEVGYADGHFFHYSFRKGLEAWVAKHNQYSTAEALQELKPSSENQESRWKRVYMRHSRRQVLKEMARDLPFRPFLRFSYMYFFRLGILDGMAGFHYCMLLSFYEYLIVIKKKEKILPPFGR